METKEIRKIHTIIKGHIKTLENGCLSKDEREFEVDLLRESLITLTRECKKHKKLLSTETIEKTFILRNVRDELFSYLMRNPWDSAVTSLYEDVLVNI